MPPPPPRVPIFSPLTPPHPTPSIPHPQVGGCEGSGAAKDPQQRGEQRGAGGGSASPHVNKRDGCLSAPPFIPLGLGGGGSTQSCLLSLGMLYFGVQVGLILLPPPPQGDAGAGAPPHCPYPTRPQEPTAGEGRSTPAPGGELGAQGEGEAGGGGPPLLTPPPTTTLIVAPPRMTTSGAGRSRSARSACWSLRGTTW